MSQVRVKGGPHNILQNVIRGKLHNKIFLVMVLVSIVPIIVAAFVSVYSIKAAHRADVAALEDAVVDQQFDQINVGLYAFETLLQPKLIVERPEMIDWTKGIVARQLLEKDPAILGISVFDLSGKETLAIDRDHPDGIPGAVLADASGENWFKKAAGGEANFGKVKFEGGEPTITLAAPGKNQAGAVVYILSGKISLFGLEHEMRAAFPGKSGYIYLAEESGKVVGGGLNGPGPGTDVKHIGIVSDVLKGLSFVGSEGQQRYKNFVGEEVVAAGRPLSSWAIIAEWPAAEADAIVNVLIFRNSIIALLVLLLVIGASIFFATLIVKPIRELEKGTELVASGKFDEEVKITTGDELEELGGAFNKMTAGLKRLEELRNEFVFVAAHELRTPVAAMKGYLTLITDGVTGPISEKTKDFVQKVINSNQRLIQLVNDLLEVSRSEGGKLAIKVAPIDVVQPIKDVLAELQPLADKQSIQLVYEPLPALSEVEGPKVLADAGRLKEVMINLVGNSIKYMGGSGTVTITNKLTTNELITSVKDTGLGMSQEAQEKLFQKFYRVASEKTRDIEGTGLGLFIVKEIIEKMNGKIWVESEEGKGSTFSFSLPVAAA